MSNSASGVIVSHLIKSACSTAKRDAGASFVVPFGFALSVVLLESDFFEAGEITRVSEVMRSLKPSVEVLPGFRKIFFETTRVAEFMGFVYF